jgi:hypothetical protein
MGRIEPFFWPKSEWTPVPSDFKLNTVQGKGYDSEVGSGRELWNAVAERLRSTAPVNLLPDTATTAATISNGFGKPQLVMALVAMAGQAVQRLQLKGIAVLDASEGLRCIGYG